MRERSQASPLILVPRKRPLKDSVSPTNVRVVYGTNGNFSSKVLAKSFMQDIVGPFVVKKQLRHATLILDSAPCHKKKGLEDAAKNVRVDLLFVPPSLTNLLQPADVSWMRPFKQRFHQKWTDWFIHEERELMRSNNPRSPGKNQMNGLAYWWLVNHFPFYKINLLP